MQNLDSKKYIDSIIGKMQEALSTIGASEEQSFLTIVHVLYVSQYIPPKDLEQIAEITEKVEKSESITRKLLKQGKELIEARSLSNYLSVLPTEILTKLLTLADCLELPSYEVARALDDYGQKKLSQPLSMIPNELADLCFRLACYGSSDEILDFESLCIGDIVDTIAVRAGNAHNVKYEMRGVGIGSSYQKALIAISGGTIQVEHQPAPNLQLVKEKQVFNVGFLADSWGKQSLNTRNPFALPHSDYLATLTDVRYLEEMIERVDGVIVCLLSPAWLNKTSGRDADYKMKLIESGMVQTVIQLPERLLAKTLIAPNLLLLNTSRKHESVKFIDATDERFFVDQSRSLRKLSKIEDIIKIYSQESDDEYSSTVSIRSILDNNGILSAKRYISSDSEKEISKKLKGYVTTALNEVADIMRCHMIKSDTAGGENYVAEIGPANIDSYFQINESKPFKEFCYQDSDADKVKKQTLRAGDIVFTMKGSVGKVALIDEEYAGYLANQSFVIIRMKEDTEIIRSTADTASIISPIVLFRYLSSDITRELVSQKFTGTTVPMVKMQDLKALQVPIPSIEEQENIIENQNVLMGLIAEKTMIENQIQNQLHEIWGLHSE